MKIVCIGRNYRAHAQELGNEVPKEPVFFLKPESALLARDAPFKIPDWSTNIHYEEELVLHIHRTCRAQQVTRLDHFVEGISIGLDMTARDVQDELKRNGLPWEKAKAFDGSAIMGTGSIALPDDLSAISFGLKKNGEQVQKGSSADLIFPFTELLTHVSRYITLEPGDLVFTGTPAGVGPVAKGDRLEGSLNGEKMLDVHVE